MKADDLPQKHDRLKKKTRLLVSLVFRVYENLDDNITLNHNLPTIYQLSYG